MASPKKYCCFLFASVLAISIFFNNGIAIEEETKATETESWLTVSLSSLLPSQTCTPFTGLKKNSSLEVIQRHGPCSELKHGKANPKTTPTHFDILSEDQARVDSIHSKLSESFDHGNMKQLDSANIPVRSGMPLNTASYIVTIGFGSPKTDLSLAFDTGSYLTWTQCTPCLVKCYNQQEPIFDPSKSTTYSRIFQCGASKCNEIFSTAKYQECANPDYGDTCIYTVKYANTDFSIGFLSKDRLTITAGDTFDNFLFGCGQNNLGDALGRTAGKLGLGRHPISFVQQTATTYDKVFSYCLPSTTSSFGHLTFGSDGVRKNVQYTPITTVPNLTSFYGISVNGITVGGIELSSVASTLSSASAVIDVSTLITRLPPSVYAALRSEFRQQMTMYPMASEISILDTCYDLSGYNDGTVMIPKISLEFGDKVKLDLDVSGIVFVVSTKQVCLAFAANEREDDVLILGSVQQKTIDVVFDLNAERLGFGPAGCM
ncbi:aspartyl protease family protein At5g10770-like [Prosopis cineraria]|uniref:aspartyl protease family protein At5g10770-like n=1 Tax=Prosopis cineraria TaxID=364024 RepID=UPI00240EF74D|nr:aspartyl protease family protein At5g10770-like [Prosopis cineraria]